MGITVAQLNNYIKQVFEAEELLHNVSVIGEICGIKQSGNAVYFTLKDADASVSCVCFYPDIMKDSMHKLIAEGTQVTVRGTVSYWNKAGKISFVVNKCETFGLGNLILLFKQLQEKLKAEGLFESTVKKSIPSEVKRIGLVTSKTGAVIHDIMTVAWRRNPSVDIVVVDTRVQGSGADAEIADAIELFNKLPPQIPPVDVIIVARGGGSAKDLEPFNSEMVARAVFASKIPVVSAVGHESDFTLIDFVADLRAATPSAAAELCVAEVTTEREKVIHLWQVLKAIIFLKIDRAGSTKEWQMLRERTLAHFNDLNAKLNLQSTVIETNNPIAVLKRGFTKTDIDPNNLKSGDEFEIMYYSKDRIAKGVAEWKRKTE